jgi:hypothetical protein
MIDTEKELKMTKEDEWAMILVSFLFTLIPAIIFEWSMWQVLGASLIMYTISYIAMKQNKQEELDKKLQREANLKILNQK